jgi:uncharacterized protein (TIGR03437 family)
MMNFKARRRRRPLSIPLLSLIIAICIGTYSLISLPRAGQAQGAFAVVSAASYAGASLAAEEIVAGFGTNLAAVAAVATTLPLPTSLNGVSVSVKDAAGTERLAPLFFVSPTQVNFLIPAGTGNGAAAVTVIRNNTTAASGAIAIAPVAPAVFSADASGKGLAAANVLRIAGGGGQSYEAVGRFDPQQNKFVPAPIELGPATDQVFLILYATGVRNRSALSAVRATIGGVNAEVSFAGAQGAFAGLDQLNIRIPRDVPGGEMDVVVTADNKTANPVRINVLPAARGEKVYLATMRPEGSAASPASGFSSLKLSSDEKQASIRFNYANLTTPKTSAHIHGPADPGQDGPILFDLDTAPRQTDGSFVWTFKQIGTTSVAQLLAALKTGRLYINVHSAKYPAGEIRGHFGIIQGSQIFTPPAAPPPLAGGPPTARAAARFLTQATFGPKAAEIIALQTQGYDGWLNDQFARPISNHLAYIDAASVGKKPSELYQQEIMESFWKNAVTGQDQLRQRIAFALSQILVVSFNSTLAGNQLAVGAYMDVLQKNAFGNFRALIEEVTLTPAMGRYLDMLGNDKEDPATGRNPNENFAREILQLFSIGLYKLHPDGSLILDANGLPIPTYDQQQVKGFAHVFTGWSYGFFPATEPYWLDPPIYIDNTQFWRVPMQAYPNHHSTLPKTLLDGKTLPAGQTAQQDLKDALDNIFNHPNTGPFIARQLIQRLVTSNPSPGYLYRVTQKFNNNGQGAG